MCLTILWGWRLKGLNALEKVYETNNIPIQTQALKNNEGFNLPLTFKCFFNLQISQDDISQQNVL